MSNQKVSTLELNNQEAIELNLDQFQDKSVEKYLLRVKGKVIGEINNHNDQLSIDIKVVPSKLTLLGKINNQTTTITSMGDVNLQCDITSHHVKVNARDLKVINMIKANEVDIESVHLNNYGSLLARSVNATATSGFENMGRIGVRDTLNIKTDHFNDKGKLRCLGNVNISCNQYIVDAQAEEVIKQQLNLHSENQDKLIEVMDCAGLMLLPKQSNIQAKSILLHDHADMRCNQTTDKSNASTQIPIGSMEVSEQIKLQDHAKLDLTQVSLLTKRLLTQNKSFFSSKQSKIKVDFLTNNANTILNETNVEVVKRYSQNEEAVSDFYKSDIHASFVKNIGKMSLHQTKFGSDYTNVDGQLLLDDSHLTTNDFLANQGSKIECSNNSEISSHQNILLNGAMTLSHTQIQAKNCQNHGDFIGADSQIEINENFFSDKNLELNNSTLNSDTFDLSGNYKIVNTNIKNASFNQQGSGSLDGIKLQSGCYATHDVNASISNSEIKSNLTMLSGSNHLSDTKMTTNILTQSDGTLSAEKTAITIDQGIFLQNKMALSLTESQIRADKVNGLLEGELNLQKTSLDFANLQLGKATTDDAVVTVADTLNLSGQQTFGDTTLSAQTITFGGETTLTDKSVAFAQNEISAFDKLSANNSQLISKGKMITNGETNLEHAKIFTNDFDAYGILKLKDGSTIRAENDLMAHTGSQVTLDASQLFANKVAFQHTLNAMRSVIKTKDDINIQFDADIQADNLLLQSDKNIILSPLSKIHGDSLFLKCDTLNNDTIVELKNGLVIDTNYLYNNGTLDGGQLLKIDANRLLFNFMGKMKADTLVSNAVLAFNLFGDIKGKDNLIYNSYFNMNLGLLRSFNASINSAVSLNYGLIIPCIPSSWKSLFSWQHLLTSSRSLLMNFFPEASTTINLAYGAAPFIYSVGKKIFDIKEAGSSPSTTPPSEGLIDRLKSYLTNLKDVRLVDTLPYVLAAKNLYFTSTMFNNNTNTSKVITNTTNSDMPWLNATCLALGPTIAQDSIINVNGLVTAAPNITHSHIIDINNGVDLAWQSNLHNSNHLLNDGLIKGDKVHVSSQTIHNPGNIDGNQVYIRNPSVPVTQLRNPNSFFASSPNKLTTMTPSSNLTAMTLH